MSNLEECHKVAAKRNGKCLSKEYVNQKELMKWQCSENHVWRSSFKNIKHKNSWCPKCLIKSKKVNLKDAHEIASLFGGKCLSEELKNSRSVVKWACKREHTWSSTYWEVSQKRWCKTCRKIEKSYQSDSSPNLIHLQVQNEKAS